MEINLEKLKKTRDELVAQISDLDKRDEELRKEAELSRLLDRKDLRRIKDNIEDLSNSMDDAFYDKRLYGEKLGNRLGRYRKKLKKDFAGMLEIFKTKYQELDENWDSAHAEWWKVVDKRKALNSLLEKNKELIEFFEFFEKDNNIEKEVKK